MSIAPFETFPAADRHVILTVGTKQWSRFCQAVGRPDLSDHPRFATYALRGEHVEELREILVPITWLRPVGTWVSEMEAIGVPCGPVNTVDQVVRDPQIKAREMLVEILDAEAGPVTVAGLPIKLSATPGALQGRAPRLGEHTEEVLAGWLHLSADEVAHLRKGGVV
jgi:CoA:oxalate CoA-transferase